MQQRMLMGATGFITADFLFLLLVLFSTEGASDGSSSKKPSKPVAHSTFRVPEVPDKVPDTVKQLQSRVAELELQVAQFKDKWLQDENTIKDLNSQIGDFKKRITEFESQHDVDAKTIAALRSQLATIQVHVQELEDQHEQDARATEQLKLENLRLAAELERALSRVGTGSQLTDALRKQIADLENQINALKLERQLRVAQIKQLQETVQSLTGELGTLTGELESAKSQVQKLIAEISTLKNKITDLERALRKGDPELLGLRGRFINLVVVIDASYSLKGNARRPGDIDWEHVKEVIETWLTKLRFDRCAVIAFNDPGKYRTFPAQRGAYARPNDDKLTDGAALSTFLQETNPKGETDTLGAMRLAYTYRPDTILLLTDGSPEVTNVPTKDMIAATIALVEANPDVPVNVVGLGNYGDQQFLSFLRSLANATGGSFMGK